MESAPDLADQAGQASSSEPGSSRPNPFDDLNSASRKKRRTTSSASPKSPSEATIASISRVQSPGVVDMVDDSASAVHTPETPKDRHITIESAQPASSSKVTINIRNTIADIRRTEEHVATHQAGTISNGIPDTPSPPSPTPSSRRISSMDQPRPSVETSDRGRPDTQRSPDSSASSSSLLSLAISSNEEQAPDPEGAIPMDSDYMIDAVPPFPLNSPVPGEELETVEEILEMVKNHIARGNDINRQVYQRVTFWVDSCSSLFERVGPQQAQRLLAADRHLWTRIHEVIFSIVSSRSAYGHEREIAEHLKIRIAVLAGQLAKIDCFTLNEHVSSEDDDKSPDLVSPIFFHMLHHLSMSNQQSRRASDSEPSLLQSPVENSISTTLRIHHGDTLADLVQLVVHLSSLHKLQGKVIPYMAFLAEIIQDMMYDASLSISATVEDLAALASRQLSDGYELWEVLSEAFEAINPKNTLSVEIDRTISYLQALSDILAICLRSEHSKAKTVLQSHRLDNPGLEGHHSAEAIAITWHFKCLSQLMRSSHLKLRVQAVGAMCNRLTHWHAVFHRTGAGGEPVHDLLRHMAHVLLNTGVIDYLLGPNCHPEIVIESGNVIAFLVVTGTFGQEHLDQIWRIITSNQDQEVDAMAHVLSVILPFFRYEELLTFWHKLGSVPLQGFSKQIRDIWRFAMGLIKAKCPNDTLPPQTFDLCLRLLRESSIIGKDNQVADPGMQILSQDELGKLLQRGPDPEGRSRLLRSCVEDLSTKSSTVIGSYLGLLLISRPAMALELRRLSQDFEVSRIVVEELETAATRTPTGAVLAGVTNRPRRDFLRDLIQHEPDTLGEGLGLRLWNVLVGPRASCKEDRTVGWWILVGIMRTVTTKNSFLEKVISQLVPSLSSEYLTQGTHDFLRGRVSILVDGEDSTDFDFEDQTRVHQSGINELWRVMLTAEEDTVALQATQTIVDIYLTSRAIRALTSVWRVHSALLTKCLSNLRPAAKALRAISDQGSRTRDAHLPESDIEQHLRNHERVFKRSMKLLKLFIHNHQNGSPYATPDIRTIMSDAPNEIKGEATKLKYQSFTGASAPSDILPLHIGCKNTVASLLGSLKRATGFDNYKAFFNGSPLLPSEEEVCRSLEDMSINDGLILVKEETEPPSAVRTKGSSSLLQLGLLTHFDELWEYLDMEAHLAKEVYELLSTLPVPSHVADKFDQTWLASGDFFPIEQPFKTIYAAHVMRVYLHSYRQTTEKGVGEEHPDLQVYQDMLKRCASLVVQVLPLLQIGGSSTALDLQLAEALIDPLARILSDVIKGETSLDFDLTVIGNPSALMLVNLLSGAVRTEAPNGISLALSTFRVICSAGILNDAFWTEASSAANFEPVVRRLVLEDPSTSVRGEIRHSLQFSLGLEASIRPRARSEDSTQRPLAAYFFGFLRSLLPIAETVPDRSLQFFASFTTVLLVLSKSQCPVDYGGLVKDCLITLLRHTPAEVLEQIEPHDPISAGTATIICHCLDIDDGLLGSCASPDDELHAKLCCGLLFPAVTEDMASQAVVLNSKTRAALCRMVMNLAQTDVGTLRAVIKTMLDLVSYSDSEEEDPYPYELPLQIERTKLIRSPTGYVGLRNLSNTCYLNSLVTQLFMNPRFRQFMLQYPIRDSISQELLFNTQKLFGYLQNSFKRWVDPTTFVQSIKPYGIDEIDVHIQMDVDEFYGILFDRWEAQLETPLDKKHLRAHYGGQLVQQVKSKECEHISEREELFSAIQCDVKGLNNLEASLQAYVDGEALEGDNKYKCSTCDRHVNAVKRACFKTLPDNVIFHLKRFDFNMRTGMRSKINERFTFPETIDMQPYTVDHLSNPDAERKTDIFQLVGILIHTGTAETGHYYSYAKDRSAEGGWVEFNDETVTAWDPAMMAQAAFGGPDTTNGLGVDKCFSAYMLFYERINSEPTPAGPTRVAGRPCCEVGPLLEESITTENTELLRRHCLFDPSHSAFINQLLRQALNPTESDQDDDPMALAEENEHKPELHSSSRHRLQTLAIRLAASHLDMIASRNKEAPRFLAPLFGLIEKSISGCTTCAQAFLDFAVKHPYMVRSLLLRNLNQDVRRFMRKTLLAAMKRISSCQPDLWIWLPHGEDENFSLLNDRCDYSTDVLSLITNLWKVFPESIRSWDDLFGVVLDYAQLGGQELNQLIRKGWLLKLVRLIIAESSLATGLPQIFSRLHRAVKRRAIPRPNPWDSILTLLDALMDQMEPVLSVTSIVEDPKDRFEHPHPPFPWTSLEVTLLHHSGAPSPFGSSLLVERLVEINQAEGPTTSILARLVRMSSDMSAQIHGSLTTGLGLNEESLDITPWLSAADVYVQHACARDRIEALIAWIASQGPYVPSTDCVAYLTFQRNTLRMERPQPDDAAAIQAAARRALCVWAPELLVRREPYVREATLRFIYDEIFEAQAPENAGTDQAMMTRQDGRAFAQACLHYIIDHFVQRESMILRPAAEAITLVVRNCATFFDSSDYDDVDVEEEQEYSHQLHNVTSALQMLVTDDYEEVESDWASRTSSPMQDYAELSANALNEMNGVILDD